MNKLITKQSAFAQGVRQEFLNKGFSEADASVLTNATLITKLAERRPDDYVLGYLNGMKKRNRTMWDKIKDVDWEELFPWILGTAGVGLLLGTKTGRNLTADGIEAVFGTPERLESMNRGAIKPLSLNN